MIAPKPARKLTHGVISSPMMLPAIAPTMISMSATEIATRIEMMEAASARPMTPMRRARRSACAHSPLPSLGGLLSNLSESGHEKGRFQRPGTHTPTAHLAR